MWATLLFHIVGRLPGRPTIDYVHDYFGKAPSKDEVVTINITTKVNVCHKGRKTLNTSKVDVPGHSGYGDGVGKRVQ